MASGNRHGKPDEEMFLQRPSHPDSPTVEPLRIHKRESRSPDPIHARPDNAQQPAFSLPPGASSSPAPLPYPDDRPRVQQRPAAAPDNSGLGRASPAYPPPSDPTRSNVPDYPPASLRPMQGRDGPPNPNSSRLAERRNNVPKPLPDSPGPEAPDKEGLFQKLPTRDETSYSAPKPSQTDNKPYSNYYQQYWPPPGESSSNNAAPADDLHVPDSGGVNRLTSTASTSTTKAQRGSPPPPETPIVPPGEIPGGDIEARYAAAGIAGTSTLTSLQAQNAAAQQRAQQYQAQQPARRPWTPTEQPGTQPHGPPTVYQGANQTSSSPPVHAPMPQGRVASPSRQPGRTMQPSALEQDMQRMHVSASPPPAYSSVHHGAPGMTAQGYPNEKHNQASTAASAATAGAAATSAHLPEAQNQRHPAFANDSRQSGEPSHPPAQSTSQPTAHQAAKPPSASVGAGPSSPPPLPEGWIAHLDSNSGQYYYIHLPRNLRNGNFQRAQRR